MHHKSPLVVSILNAVLLPIDNYISDDILYTNDCISSFIDTVMCHIYVRKQGPPYVVVATYKFISLQWCGFP